MRFPLIAYIAFGSILAPFILSLAFLDRFQRGTRPLIVLFGAYSAVLVTQRILGSQGINNLWTSHLYNVLEVVLVLHVFSMWLASKRTQRVYRATMLLYMTLWLSAKIFWEAFDVPGLTTPVISRVVLLASSLHVLFAITATDSERPLMAEPRFWYAGGFLVSAAGSLMFYALRTVMDAFPLDDVYRVLSINWTIITLSNLMFVVGILCKPRVRNSGGQLELAP